MFNQAMKTLRSAAKAIGTTTASLAVLATTPLCLAQPFENVEVYVSGTNGYNTFRIPAIVKATNGDLLAFAEGRKNSRSDTGDIDLVLRRSSDGGQTWSPIQIVANDGVNTVGNPAPVVDQNTGRVFLVTTRNLGQDSQTEIIDGTSDGSRTVWIQHSDNHGLSWTTPTEITGQVKEADWRWYATTPGHGIQMARTQPGRLVIPFNYAAPTDNGAGVIYSDDNGVNWNIGGIVEGPSVDSVRPSESTAVELTGGQLYLNSRNRTPEVLGRAEAYSFNGGLSWINIGEAEELIDPVVQGSVVRFSAIDQGAAQNRILFSNPNHPSRRWRMSVRSSFDETASWDDGKLIYRGGSAYSDLVAVDDDVAGLLYENGSRSNANERISFARFADDWLDDPSALYMDFGDGTATDQRGYALDGTILGSPTVIAGAEGLGGSALSFDGQQDMIVVADTDNHPLDFDNEDSFTLEVVFRTTDHGDGGTIGSGPLISKDVGPSQPSFWLRLQDGRPRFLIDDGSSVASVFPSEIVTDGNWHHLAAVRDAESNELRLYLNRELIGTSADNTTDAFANGNDLIIGAFNASSPGDRRFVGDIDMVRIAMAALDADDFFGFNVTGDFNANDALDPEDLEAIYAGTSDSNFDLNGDQQVDASDVAFWVESLYGSRLGDVNLDRQVDLIDLSILAANFGSLATGWSEGDFDLSFGVNLIDLSLLASNFGFSASAVPEPTGIGLMIVGSGVLHRRRLRHHSSWR
ncbi:MAG: exo-alpha-sialidase [Phycisphaeraceae bacterium]